MARPTAFLSTDKQDLVQALLQRAAPGRAEFEDLVIVPIFAVIVALIVGALIAIWQIRRTVKRQPGVFEVSVRNAGADTWPRQPSYARVIRDVLVLTRGVALLRAEVLPVDAVIEFDLDETPYL